jgi:hypothetical protein
MNKRLAVGIICIAVFTAACSPRDREQKSPKVLDYAESRATLIAHIGTATLVRPTAVEALLRYARSESMRAAVSTKVPEATGRPIRLSARLIKYEKPYFVATFSIEAGAKNPDVAKRLVQVMGNVLKQSRGRRFKMDPPKSPSAAKRALEQEQDARKWLDKAKVSMKDKYWTLAKVYLKEAVYQYPGTRAAKEAQELQKTCSENIEKWKK